MSKNELKIEVTKNGVRPNWDKQQIEYLSEAWGQISLDTTAKKLNRTKGSLFPRNEFRVSC